MYDLTFEEALEKREHLIALDQTNVYLRKDSEFPFAKTVDVVEGSSWRLSGPTSALLIAEQDGLTFRMNVEFEHADANGRGVSLFDRERLRDVMQRLPAAARQRFAGMLERTVLPPLQKRTAEYREALNSQLDSEDCVRGLIALASESPPTTS